MARQIGIFGPQPGKVSAVVFAYSAARARMVEKIRENCKKPLDNPRKTCYNTKVGMERWLSWSKAHDWKSCER